MLSITHVIESNSEGMQDSTYTRGGGGGGHTIYDPWDRG